MFRSLSIMAVAASMMIGAGATAANAETRSDEQLATPLQDACVAAKAALLNENGYGATADSTTSCGMGTIMVRVADGHELTAEIPATGEFSTEGANSSSAPDATSAPAKAAKAALADGVMIGLTHNTMSYGITIQNQKQNWIFNPNDVGQNFWLGGHEPTQEVGYTGGMGSQGAGSYATRLEVTLFTDTSLGQPPTSYGVFATTPRIHCEENGAYDRCEYPNGQEAGL